MANEYYGSITPSTKTAEQRRDAGEILDYTSRSVRLAADGGQAEVVVNPSNVVIATDSNTAIGVANGNIVLDGKVSFTHGANDIAINGFYRLNQDLMQTLPSTLANPIETLIFKYPAKVKQSSSLIALLSNASNMVA
jgi:hypothetical protein